MDNYECINPLDKIDDILERFKDLKPEVYSKTDEGYDWLEYDDSKCVIFKNPYNDNNLEIEINDAMFTVYFDAWHSHYREYSDWYEGMIQHIDGILKNEICAGTIKDKNGKWFGSHLVKREEINNDPQTVFESVFKEKEFKNKLEKNGYTVEYNFWDPVDSVTKKYGKNNQI